MCVVLMNISFVVVVFVTWNCSIKTFGTRDNLLRHCFPHELLLLAWCVLEFLWVELNGWEPSLAFLYERSLLVVWHKVHGYGAPGSHTHVSVSFHLWGSITTVVRHPQSVLLLLLLL